MIVYELDAYQLAELKDALFYGCHENGNLDLEEQSIIDSCSFSSEIPNEIVYDAFSGYDFVEEDF